MVVNLPSGVSFDVFTPKRVWRTPAQNEPSSPNS
jgi:hypothetical protein